MAYNPFNIFRRNQRAIFSVVTVFIMFTFVLSSGLGGGNDFFDWFPRWFGSKTKKGEQFCTIDGTRIYSQDVAQVRAKRVMARRFMELATQQALSALSRTLSEQRAQATPLIVQQIQQALANPQEFARMSQSILGSENSKSADK